MLHNKQRALKLYAALYYEIFRFVFVNWSHRHLKIKYFINMYTYQILYISNILLICILYINKIFDF